MVELILRRRRGGVKVGRYLPGSPRIAFLCFIFFFFLIFLSTCTREKAAFFIDPVWWELYGKEEKGLSPLEKAADAARLRIEPIRGEFRDGNIHFSENIGNRVTCLIATSLAAETVIENGLSEEGGFFRGVLLNWYAPAPKGWKVVRFDYRKAYFDAGELFAVELIKGATRGGGIGLGAALFLSPGSSGPAGGIMETRAGAFKSGFESGKRGYKESDGPILRLEVLEPETERQKFLQALEEILKSEPDALLISGFDFTRYALEALFNREETKNILVIVEEGLKIPNFIELIDYSIETDIYALLEEAFMICTQEEETQIVTVEAVLKKNR